MALDYANSFLLEPAENDGVYPSVYLHDPNYFFFTKNPTSVPRLTLEVLDGSNKKPNHTTLTYYLSVKKVSMMSTKESPCDTKPKESFQACLKSYHIKVKEINICTYSFV